MVEADLLYSDLTRKIIGAAMEVHSTLGPGFLENVYEEALAVEFQLRNIRFERQKNVDVFYKNVKIKNYVCDVMVENKVLIELKALNELTTNEHAQTLNYLKATGLKVGLLFNFGQKSLKYKRFIKEKSV
ncbi:MAG: GxxExxY protein [Phycisphaerae bacterium]|nr:GxxExxY protein [Phycisphaerae bacterium]